MSEWKETELGEVANIQTGPFGSQLKNEQYITGGTPVVTVEHIKDFKIIDFDFPSITEKDRERLSKYLMQSGDILFTRVGSVDLSAYVSERQDGWMFSSRMLRVRPTNAINSRFLSYFFQQKSFRDYILNISVGATMPSINTGILKTIPISYPPFPEQTAIASVLSSLDDKIDLLHRQNATLEKIAETLFRQWFVEEAKEEWEMNNLNEFISVKHGFAFKGTFITSEPNNFKLVTPGNFKIGGGFKTDKFKYYTDLNFPKDYIFQTNDLIVTMTDLSVDGDTLGSPALIPESYLDELYLHNQRVGKVLFKKGISKYFLYNLMRTEDYKMFIHGCASGTSIRHTSPTSICSYSFVKPPNRLLEEYDKIVIPLYNKIVKNQTQIRTLTALRDTLLPKLMSGEIRVDF